MSPPPHGSLSTSTLTPSTANDEKTLPAMNRFSRAALNLPPSFFSINMGTGIVSILLYKLPYNADWVRWIGVGIFAVNVLVFILLSLGTIVRYIRWKGVFGVVGRSGAGMFWGTLPMGLATIINMIVYVCVPYWGRPFAYLALTLWYIDVFLSILINIGMIFSLFTRQSNTTETISSTWLLPIVTSVVAAASGGIVADALLPFHAGLARGTLIISYMVWGTGVPIAMMMITLWILRSAMYGLPPTGALCSVFLPLGPCGQGAFGIALLGRVSRELTYDYQPFISSTSPERNNILGEAIYAGGIISALILWGLGLVFYILAIAIVIDHILKPGGRKFFQKQGFSIGFWALTFPIGVFATATIELSQELDSDALRVIAMIISLQVVLHWAWVGGMTILKMVDGSLFEAPEIKGWDGEVPVRWSKESKA